MKQDEQWTAIFFCNFRRDGYEFMWNEHHGFILTCPSNLGTGMRAGVHVRLPLLGKKVVTIRYPYFYFLIATMLIASMLVSISFIVSSSFFISSCFSFFFLPFLILFRPCRETAFCSYLKRRPRHLSREGRKGFYYLEESYARRGPHRISTPARLGRVRIETIMPRRSYAGFSFREIASPLWTLI